MSEDRTIAPARLIGRVKSTPETVRKQESDAASMMECRGMARRRPGSGSNDNAKGDAVSAKDLGECKQTAGATIPLALKWLAKIYEEATGSGRKPFLHLRFLSAGRHIGAPLSWVAIPDYWFRELIETYEAHHADDE